MQKFITEESDYLDAVRNVESVFDTTARLPAGVFQRSPKRTAFFEFDDLFEDIFWRTAQELARQCDDPTIDLLVIDPNAESYFRKHFGVYGAAALSARFDAADYRELLACAPPGSPADSLTHNGRILALAGSGGRFGFWCERELEIGVIGLFDGGSGNSVPTLPSTMKWRSVDEALALMAPTFLARQTPSDLAAALRANYQT